MRKLIVYFSIHLYLSSVWLDMHPRMDTKKICVQKRLDYICALSTLIILSSKVNIIGGNPYDIQQALESSLRQ